MNTTSDYIPFTLPAGVSLDAVLELGAAMGRQAAAVFLAGEAGGLHPTTQREAEGLSLAVIDDLDAAVAALDRVALGVGDDVARALRAAMRRWCEAGEAQDAEMVAAGI